MELSPTLIFSSPATVLEIFTKPALLPILVSSEPALPLMVMEFGGKRIVG